MPEELQIDIDANTYAALEESRQSLYSQDGDRYVLPGIIGMKRARDEEKTRLEAFKGLNAEAARKALETIDSMDFDPDDARSALAFKKQMEERELIGKGDYEAAKEKYETEAKTAQKKLQEKLNRVIEREADKTLQIALVEHGVKADRADLAVSELKKNYIKPAINANDEVEWRDHNGVDAADLEAIMGKLKTERDFLFDSEYVPGSGSNGNSNRSQPVNTFDADPLERLKQARANTG